MTEQTKSKFNPKAAISRGKVAQPLRVFIYGQEGVGKSTLASNAPAPLIIGAEDGTAHLNVARYQPNGWVRKAGAEDEPFGVLDWVNWFGTPDASDFQTLVIDTADMAERMCIEYCCNRDNGTSEPTKKYDRTTIVDGKPYLDGYGYGGGPKVVETEFLELIAAMDRARRARNVHFVFTAHSDVVKEKNAGGDDYGVIAPRLLKPVREQLMAWCDLVAYCEFSRIEIKPADKDKKTGKELTKAKVVTDGERIMHTQRGGAFIAKNRLGLPSPLEMDWAVITEHAQAAYGDATAQIASLKEEIARLSLALPEDRRAKLAAAVEKRSSSVLGLVELKGKVLAAVAEQAAASGAS